MAELVKIYKQHFDTCDALWDVGTRDGNDAAYLAKELAAKSVYAIDANPTAIQKTKSNYPEMNVIHTAIADYEGEAEFTEVVSDNPDYAGCSSLTVRMDNTTLTHRKHKVKVTTLESLFESAPDLVKIDLEGYTYEALRGMGDTLQYVKCLHLETELQPHHEGAKTSQDVADFMIAAGFELKAKLYEWAGVEDQVWINPKG